MKIIPMNATPMKAFRKKVDNVTVNGTANGKDKM